MVCEDTNHGSRGGRYSFVRWVRRQFWKLLREGCVGRRPQPPVRPASAGAYGSVADPGASPAAPSDIIDESFLVFWRGTA
jgi:hypothetical protein